MIKTLGWGVVALSVLTGCSAPPDLSGISAEKARQVHRYDMAQAIAANDKIVVAGTQSGVMLVSADQGKNWHRHPIGNASIVDVTACGSAGFLAIDHYKKVWFADATGENWQSIALDKPQTPIAVACDAQGGWWVSGAHSVIAGSKDQGKTWQITDFGEDIQITALQFIDAQRAVAFGEFGLTLFSDDGGISWTKGPTLSGEFYPYAALFANANEGWVSGIAGQILATHDGGKTWHKQSNDTQASLHRLFMHDGVPFGVGAGGVIAKLEGSTWRNQPYTDAVPVFLGGGASLPGQSALVIGGPGGLLRTVATGTKQ